MSPDDDSPEPELDPPEWADVRIDRSRLVRATPLTLRPKPVEHLAPDTIDDDREREAAK